jgi:C_GCAxxG_C_C family probable redox protein
MRIRPLGEAFNGERFMDHVSKGVSFFNEGGNCSQAVLYAFAEELGLDETMAIKLASGFGGGIGCSGGVCGALTGAVLAMGLMTGNADVTDKTAKAETYRKTRLLCEEFKLRAGSMECRELLGFDMGRPEGQLAAKNPGAFHDCPGYVKIAIELVQEMSNTNRSL